VSRGPGNIQQSILAASRRNTEVSLHALCWELGAPAGGELPTDFYKSFRRAVLSLERSGRIAIVRRGLRDVGEVVRFYPSKATSLQVRQLRQRLLPVMKSYFDETGDCQFGEAKNELHVLKKKPPPPHITAGWQPIERRLLQKGTDAQTLSDRTALIELLSVGHSLFVMRSRSISKPLKEAIKQFAAAPLGAADDELRRALDTFYQACFDETEHRKVQLKDRLYAVVDFASNKRSYLKPNFMEQLLKRDPEYVRKLPGHADHRYKEPFGYEPTRYSSDLDGLLRRDVLSKFEFLHAG
jgi:hypothetical protein